ncbi:transmembrane anchored protein [Devosia geojensis]|nr:transmembrane anchored protein [Devosia geojensis]
MKLLFAVIIAISAMSTSVYAGNCNVPSDRAADGSRCGDRAASERPGGN